MLYHCWLTVTWDVFKSYIQEENAFIADRLTVTWDVFKYGKPKANTTNN